MARGPQLGRRELMAGAAGVLAGVTLLGLSPAQAVPVAAGVTKFDVPTGGNLRILVTGDAGSGTSTQWAVANAAREFHAREPFSLALGLGDNIYESGPNDDHDVQFASKFELPNAGMDFRWVMVLGNHDNTLSKPGDGGWLERGNFEVGYHANSAHWWMPSRYYSQRVPEQNPLVEFFVLDLCPLAAHSPSDSYFAPDGQFMNEQAAWLDRALTESTAQWKFVCTHHPYLSNGPHGNAGRYDGLPDPVGGTHVKQFFEDHVLGRVPFLLSGHDHTLQVLEPTAATKGTRQIVSGAACKTSSADKKAQRGGENTAALFETLNELGFMALDLTPDTVNLRVVTVDPATGVGSQVFDRRLA
ncbi:phosphoesterase [Nocardia sp. SYP-A9097]|uniref:metallophosphoesterase n=1 Tax=Nocardia sp. SYP-A9097 TaxID=2663237 RepID=UPI00129A45A7|nr:metallophosphoesterase [Nocardia sp. SYP-A9097]MRH89911.1 phosphoesterase [Nocardia sp. SYP-A9097]